LAISDLENLILTCGNTLALRLSHTIDPHVTLETLCADEEEYTRAEVLLHEAIADQRLRSLIDRQSADDIAALVNGLIMRAIRG
jgi:hypothetical protein